MVKHISSEEFEKEVLNHKGVVFVDFWAPWCAPCKLTSPIVEELSEELKDLKFVSINVDKNQNLASQYNIYSIPTFMIFKNGKVENQFVGARPKEYFLEEIKKVAK